MARRFVVLWPRVLTPRKLALTSPRRAGIPRPNAEVILGRSGRRPDGLHTRDDPRVSPPRGSSRPLIGAPQDAAPHQHLPPTRSRARARTAARRPARPPARARP